MGRGLVAGLDVPVIAAPMFLVSGPELVIGAARAGILGAFPAANCRSVRQLDQWMGHIASSLDGWTGGTAGTSSPPWAVNLITHRSNFSLGEQIELLSKHRPPVVISAMGSPQPLREVVAGYGGLVFADVVNMSLAHKAIDAGADGLICVCAGAGGHTGHLSPFAFTSAVRHVFDGVIAVSGGISDGSGVAAAISAGADLAVLGTRFIATNESLAPVGHKQMVVDSVSADVIVSSNITGAPASWLRPSLLANQLDPNNLPNMGGVDVARRPKNWSQIWSAGQSVHAVRAVEPIREVVRVLKTEYHESAQRLADIAARTSSISCHDESGARCQT